MSNVSKARPSVKKKTICRVKNWATYNRFLIARGSLTLSVDNSSMIGSIARQGGTNAREVDEHG
ncbi:MAG TPA: hypothetical protein EYG11_24310 [Candidatus Latescibacteria bacterium]|nr:hypothetical protein [Candidatus Handelsmanbacteria bacterium]HIL11823.1 hypothetical protein [Candidatus Latescibacterota bacterium]